jgi:hypothetical protein
MKSPDEGMKWMMSDEGKTFMRQSNEGWYRASVANGTDPEQAKAAADRCIAAYGG